MLSCFVYIPPCYEVRMQLHPITRSSMIVHDERVLNFQDDNNSNFFKGTNIKFADEKLLMIPILSFSRFCIFLRRSLVV